MAGIRLSQIRLASNGFGKQVFHLDGFAFAAKIRERDGNVAAKFPRSIDGRRRKAESGLSVSVATAMALKPRSPSLMALKMATRSARSGAAVGGVFHIAAAENAAGAAA